MGDYRLNGKTLIDIKSPTGSGKWTIDNQFKNHFGQAEVFIIDLTDCKLEVEEAYRQLEEMLNGKNREWVKKVIVKKGEELLRICERI